MNALVIIGLAFLAVVQGGVISGKNAKCDNQRFQTSTDAFAKEFGLPAMPTDANEILKKMNELIKQKGLDGQKQICKAFQDLKTSLGDQYSSCISLAYLESIGEKPQDAGILVVLGNQENYICTTGWDVFSKNWDCITDVTEKSSDALAKCQTDYVKKMQKDPANMCKYAQQMIDCYVAPFKACGPAVKDAFCQTIKVDLDSFAPQCSIKCSK